MTDSHTPPPEPGAEIPAAASATTLTSAEAAGTVRVRDDTGWQHTGSYSRAVRRGGWIVVSGTTATGPDGGALHPGDTYAQTVDCLDRVIAAIGALGGVEDDIVRTRIMLAPQGSWQEATRAHGDRMAEVLPANTTVYIGGLIGEGFLVEVEAEAVLLP